MARPPLDGIRVLDLTRLLPGGLCTLVLADLGADVIKVEAPGGGDYARQREPMLAEATEPTTASASFRALNRNKRSVVLNLKDQQGREALLQVATTADVLVESFRPGVMDRLGLGYDALALADPRLVVCHISGWGQDGPMAGTAGHDVNYLAAMGLLSPGGGPDDPPSLPAMQVGDSAAGLFAATSILAALREREHSGLGQEIDVSISHAALSLAAMAAAGVLSTGETMRASEGVWTGGVVCYQVYPCRDGWVALGALEEKFWTAWCAGVDRMDLVGKRHEPPGSATHQEIARIMAARTRAEWRSFATVHDCCLTVLESLLDALGSPLVRDRGMVPTLPTDESGTHEGLGLPVVLSRTPPVYDRRLPPSLGADTRAVLAEAGLPDEMIGQLTNEGRTDDSQRE